MECIDGYSWVAIYVVCLARVIRTRFYHGIVSTNSSTNAISMNRILGVWANLALPICNLVRASTSQRDTLQPGRFLVHMHDSHQHELSHQDHLTRNLFQRQSDQRSSFLVVIAITNPKCLKRKES